MKNAEILKKCKLFIFFFLSLLYLEIVLKLFTCKSFFDTGLIFMPLFTICEAVVLTVICSFLPPKVNRTFTAIFMWFFFILFGTQAVYHKFFDKYLIFFSLTAGGADQIITDGILKATLDAIVSGLPAIAFLSVPLISFYVLRKRWLEFPRRKLHINLIGILAATLAHFLVVACVNLSPSDKFLYFGTFDPNLTVKSFGLVRTEILDMKYNIFGFEQSKRLEIEHPLSSGPADKSYTANVQNIDFNALMKNEQDETAAALHKYFAAQHPTYKNAYTGMFKGYNLVMVVAEGFSPYAVDSELTPTLYKMSTSGFNFKNFYTPIWGVSTSDGEYTACNGLIPKSGVWSFYRSSENYVPYTLGNQFKKAGVNKLFAYHNNTHAFYHRDLSHPNMGYTYKGIGNGLEEFVTDCWPQSDLEMFKGTTADYVRGDEPFHAYYMTVSGHLNYNYNDNAMVQKNWDKVKHLDCSDTVKSYYACNIELDLALEHLLKELNKAGIADKTVIAITPDHYPYGLEADGLQPYKYFNEIAGHEIDPEFELYKSNFILYCQGMEDRITVDKYCSSLDILPTLSNLFGFEYDSRLLMGSDILSTSKPLVIFSTRSWISEKGRYNAETKEFTAFSGQEFSSTAEQRSYINNINAIVNNKFMASALMLDCDYYAKVLKN